MNEDVRQPDVEAGELRQRGDDFVRHQVETARPRLQANHGLVPAHRVDEEFLVLWPADVVVAGLRDIEGFDYQQMADILGLPLGTLKSRLFRLLLRVFGRLRIDSRRQLAITRDELRRFFDVQLPPPR